MSNGNNSDGDNSNGDNNPLSPYFISHSGNDREIVNIILRIFRHHGRRPFTIMNMEELSLSQDAYWLQIKNRIQESDAVLLILSGGIIEREHTQNWVAFEVGVAAGCDKPVIAIRGEDVNIPIPYLNHYYAYSPTFPAPYWKESESQNWEGLFHARIYPMLSNANYRPPGLQNHCPHCKLCYFHHGWEQPFRCPYCSRETSRIEGSSNSIR